MCSNNETLDFIQTKKNIFREYTRSSCLFDVHKTFAFFLAFLRRTSRILIIIISTFFRCENILSTPLLIVRFFCFFFAFFLCLLYVYFEHVLFYIWLEFFAANRQPRTNINSTFSIFRKSDQVYNKLEYKLM